jgi:hypothetical protein
LHIKISKQRKNLKDVSIDVENTDLISKMIKNAKQSRVRVPLSKAVTGRWSSRESRRGMHTAHELPVLIKIGLDLGLAVQLIK